jgi:hypothetical protein
MIRSEWRPGNGERKESFPNCLFFIIERKDWWKEHHPVYLFRVFPVLFPENFGKCYFFFLNKKYQRNIQSCNGQQKNPVVKDSCQAGKD